MIISPQGIWAPKIGELLDEKCEWTSQMETEERDVLRQEYIADIGEETRA